MASAGTIAKNIASFHVVRSAHKVAVAIANQQPDLVIDD